ncbi:hypothetical protein BKN38_05135 [Helicobacter sp. CLO-3]|nr:hypothetical protein BA723_06730 [Helicobacter sp. CLO-3]OHU83707.1 hypothetical protein BKN38_05135 [Helicobacter sp. CLO-3]
MLPYSHILDSAILQKRAQKSTFIKSIRATKHAKIHQIRAKNAKSQNPNPKIERAPKKWYHFC